MSENVKRTGRELVYQGAILNVYKDHMEFANGNTAEWDLSIMTGRRPWCRYCRMGGFLWYPSTATHWNG